MSRIIEIKHGETSAEISTEGAEIVSFRGRDGIERIWQADPAVWGKHSPVLFPVVCAVKENRIIVDGQSYPMTKHGFLRGREFTVIEQTESAVELAVGSNEETEKMYPFSFEVHVRFEVSDDGFRCMFKVLNRTEKRMPFCIGGHPGFICPTEEGSVFEDYELVFPQKESGERGLLTSDGEICGTGIYEPLRNNDRLRLDHSFFDRYDTLILTQLKSRSVKLISRKTGHGILFEFGKMPVLAVWTKPDANADYVCLEPWHGLPAGTDETAVLEDKPFALKLEGGKTFETGYSVSIIR